MIKVIGDLHLHSVLSPCAENDMIPRKIFAKAQAMGIDLVAITDHNSAENVHSFLNIAQEYDITLLPGMEVQTKEEVHLLTFFSDIDKLIQWQNQVYNNMIVVQNNPSIYGEQYLLNSAGIVEGNLKRMLLTSTCMSIREVFRKVENLGGLCIPAHVDRPRYGIFGQLGSIPDNIGIEGVEVSPYHKRNEAWRARLLENDLGVICSSDAHYLEDVGKGKTLFYINEISLPEIRLALRGERERWTEVL